jgi:hypothetical protein
MRTRVALLVLLLVTVFGGFSVAREAQVQEGDLWLRGEDVLVIEDKALLLHGHIRLEGSSRLVIKNSFVIFEASSPSVFGTGAEVTLGGSSQLELINSNLYVDSRGDRIRFWVNDSSLLEMTNTDAWHTKVFIEDRGTLRIHGGRVGEVAPLHSSVTQLVDCTIGWAISLEFADGDEIDLAGLAPGTVDSWQLPSRSLSAPPRPSISVRNCDVGGWSVHSIDSTIRLTDCTLVRLGLYWSDPAGTITGMSPGYFASWESSEELDTTGDVEVGLFDTLVSEVINLGIMQGSSDVTITSSNVSLQVWNYTGVLSVLDTVIQAFAIGTSDFMLDTSGSTLIKGFDLRRTDITLDGDFAVASGAAFHAWEDSTCTRVFQIRVVDDQGQGISDARVEVADEWGTAVGYRCDESGVATIRIVFNDGNRDSRIELRAVVDGRTIGTASVGIFSPGIGIISAAE